ncbi:SDR family oxidoreductase [Paracoccus sp. p4-l81]|uniref:SDR family oxidoreductase n=1 Tax=unclassified Paracoccus (in: a-proteobacteria) TaxID=2688777 RepID=UPI0035B72B66
MAGVMVITGASAGIGRAVAERALADGWSVAMLARRADVLADLAAGQPRALACACDVTDSAQVEAAFDAATARFGRIDVVFNNAGVLPRAGTIDTISDADWAQGLAVNLTGMFNAARAGFARMRAQDPQGGRIINNGSVSAQAPRPGSVIYTTTKHAITGLTRTLALDGRAFGIAAGQIDIGNVRTDLADQIARGVPQADGSIRAEPMMDMGAVCDAVMTMAAMPPGANVLNLTVMASSMPLVGRG